MLNYSYPTVVMLTKDHQIPSITPVVKEGGKWSEFLDLSYNLK